MTVYFVHPIDDDVSSARQYGEIKTINYRFVFPDELQADGQLPPIFISKMANAVAEFNPDQDFLAIAGDQLQVAFMSAALAVLFAQFRLLRYDRQARGYVPVTIRVEV